MVEHILADHLALHDTGLREVGADEGALLVALEQLGGFRVIGGNSTVEEHGRNVLFLDGVHQGFGGADRAGLNEVDDHGVRAGDQSGIDIVGLGLLIRVGILVNDRQALRFHRGVQSGTHAGEIHVAKRIPRHIGFTFSRRDTAEHGKTQRASQHLGNKLFHGKHLFFLFQRESSR